MKIKKLSLKGKIGGNMKEGLIEGRWREDWGGGWGGHIVPTPRASRIIQPMLLIPSFLFCERAHDMSILSALHSVVLL